MRVYQANNRQRGFTLTEALVSFSVTAVGLLTVVSFQGDLFTESAYNKARAEALSLAQQKIEQFKHYTLSDEGAFIDDNGDGVMDPDGSYGDDPIAGQNAVFTRSWELDTGDQAKSIDVTVSWADSANVDQSVSLTAMVPWISPRAGADQVAELLPPELESPTGRAMVGEGDLGDYPNAQPIMSPGNDGLSIYQNDENLLLVDGESHVLLTLLDACNLDTQQCTDFVKISGTVYVDRDNTRQALEDTFVIASDAAYCSRWVTDGSIGSPPRTDSGDYEYYHYTCYLGGGWHGNIGFVATDGLLQTDKVCQGDPTSLNAWEQPVIALRRAYRGMLSYTLNGDVVYKSHGIADATQLNGHDFVFTQLPADLTEGVYCAGLDGPMTRTDSRAGALFTDVPTDFFCLNQDSNYDSVPDYLDAYDSNAYSASTTCPYDPTDPPVHSWSISGAIGVVTASSLDLRDFSVTTSDGPGNCEVTAFESISEGYVARYRCTVYDWGTGWTGFVQLQPNNTAVYCSDDMQSYTEIGTDQTRHYTCLGGDAVTIQGRLEIGDRVTVAGMAIVDLLTGRTGYCTIGDLAYRCVLPYDGDSTSLAIAIETDGTICGYPDAVMMYEGYSAAQSPYRHDLTVVSAGRLCPVTF